MTKQGKEDLSSGYTDLEIAAIQAGVAEVVGEQTYLGLKKIKITNEAAFRDLVEELAKKGSEGQWMEYVGPVFGEVMEYSEDEARRMQLEARYALDSLKLEGKQRLRALRRVGIY